VHERITRIKTKIEAARGYHSPSRLETGDTWSEEKITALEEKYGFTYPADCRAFLLNIGDKISGLHIEFKDYEYYYEKASAPYQFEQKYTSISIFGNEFPHGTLEIGMYQIQELWQDALIIILNGKFRDRLAYQDMGGVTILDFPDFLAMLEDWIDSLTSVVPKPVMQRASPFVNIMVERKIFPYEPKLIKSEC
jgi:hypothetical protein